MRNLLSIAVVTLLATPTVAQHAHGSAGVAETGQAQFAALAEIVTVLRNDPSTKWETVDIDALRSHLIDMDNLKLKASVEVSTTGNLTRFVVTGEGATASSIRNMIPAHAPMLATETGWDVSAQPIDNGAIMDVIAPSQQELQKIVGLGFHGLMTIGAHHQEHHLMIASGRTPH
jgi:hypothetical protein